MKRNMIRLVTLLCAFPASGMVMAHSGSHEMSGLFAGISHPLAGADHLAVMLAVGLWAGIGVRRQTWMPVVAFLVCMVCAAALGMAGIVLPGIESGITASVLVMGLLLAASARLPATVGIVLISVFALFHGNAHGAEMPAAAVPVLYGFGFLMSTAVLLTGGVGLERLVRRARGEWLLRGAGVMTGGFGAWLLLGA